MRRALGGLVAIVLGSLGALRLGHSGPRHDEVASLSVARSSFERRVTAEGIVRAVTATPVFVPQLPNVFEPITLKVAWIAPDGVEVKTGDVILRLDPTDPEKQLREAQAELDKALTQLHKEQITSAAAIADRVASETLARQTTAQTLRFPDNDPLLFSRRRIAESELEGRLAVATQVEAEHETRTERVMARTRLELAAIARDRAADAVAHAKTALASMVIRAPSDGILVLRRNDRGDVPKLGDQLYSDNTIAEIPLLDHMEAELFVLEVDGSGLDVGQPADIVVESHPDLTFHGKIRLVDKLAKPRQQRVPVQYFSVIVALDRTDRAVMKPGQRVRGKLVLDSEHALVVPRQAVFERAGTSFVYRRGEHGYVPVTVELGAATSGLVVIKAGLAEGDVIAERDPAHGGSDEVTP